MSASIEQVGRLGKDFLRSVHRDVCSGSYEMSFDSLFANIEQASVLFAAVVDGDVVGFSEATVNSVSSYRATVSAAVRKTHQGHGIGPKLLAAALAWCDVNGIEYVDGWAWEDNERALEMDARQGFKVVGRIEDAYRRPDGSSRNQVILVRSVGWQPEQ